MTDNPAGDFDITSLPTVVNAVLDLAPTGEMWRARFAVSPLTGSEMLPADDEGYLSLLYEGDLVMQIHLDTFRTSIEGGRARVVVDGAWREIELQSMPDDEHDVPDEVPPEWTDER
jgi:hypothetical protein